MPTDLDRITERYRARQAAIAAKSALQVGSYWKGVEVGNEDSEANFIQLSLEAVSSGFLEGMEYAREFTRERVAVTPEAIFPNHEQIAASLSYVGPILARRAMYAGEDFDTMLTPQQARRHVERQVRGSAVRLTAEGSRRVARSVQSKRIGWMRVTKGEAPCFFCVALASRGPVYEDDSFDRSDPRFTGPGDVKVHDSCVVGSTTVAGPSVEAGTRRWYEGPLVIIRTASGKQLSITPNHPVLTEDGWIPAGLVHEGSNVVGGSIVDGALRGAPDEGQHPTRIEDLLRTLLVVGSPLLVPGAPHQFHGDGTKAEVDVVATDRLLSHGLQPAFAQPAVESPLSVAGSSGPSLGLSSLCPAHHLALAGDAPDVRLMGGGDGVGTLLGGHLLPAQRDGLAHGANVDIALLEHAADDPAAYSVLERQRLLGGPAFVGVDDLVARQLDASAPRFDPASFEFSGEGRRAYAALGSGLRERLAGLVDLDAVVEVSRVSFSGHVYNLQTSEGWYSADGVIVSNCACAMIPVTEAEAGQISQLRRYEELWSELSGKDPKKTDSTPLVTFRRNYEEMLRSA